MHREFYEQYWSGDSAPPDMDPTTPARKDMLAKALSKLVAGSPVLDMGCGRGEFTAYLSSLGFDAWGVDMASAAIEAARKSHPQSRFELLSDDGSAPVADGHFSAVWSSEVIEHVFDVHTHLSEINRVLVEGGLCVMTTPYHGVLKNLLICLHKFDSHFDPELSHIRFFDKAGLARCFSRAGFEVVRWGGIGRLRPFYRCWFVTAVKRRPPSPPATIRG